MKLLFILFLLSLLTACASTAQKGLTEEDKRVQQHELYVGDVDSAEISKDKLVTTKSGTRFDKTHPDNLTPTEISNFKKQEFIEKGDTSLQSGDFDLALYAYIRALIEDNQDKGLYFKIGNLHEIRGDSSLASLAYKKSLDLDPGFVNSLERQGRLKLNERAYDEARVLFNRAISEDQKRVTERTNHNGINPLDSSSPYFAYSGIGIIEDLDQQHLNAITSFNSAIQIRPNSASAENNLGYSYYLNQDLDAAENHFKRAISKDKSYAKAWTNLALVYVRKSKFLDAINVLIDHTDNKPSAYNTVGYICMLEGKHEQAEEFFNKAIDLSPTYFEIAVENRDLNRRRYSASVYQALN